MESKNRVIFHIDVNSAYLSWEASYRVHHLGAAQDLREIPSVVGGDVTKRQGIILAKSLPAKKYRIQNGDSTWEARQKCPNLVLVPPNYGLYDRSSKAFMEILKEFSPDIEQYSIDEAYVDMTETLHFFRSPVHAADEIRGRIEKELGYTVNVGISQNKLLAKMASDFEKPNRTHTLFQEEIPVKLWPLPVKDLFFAGPAAVKKLHLLGIDTVGELAHIEPGFLNRHLKKQGEILWAFANGIDGAKVEAAAPENKGYGNSATTPYDVAEKETARKVLLSLTETLAARLRKDKKTAGMLSVTVKDREFKVTSHQKQLPVCTDITEELYSWACVLLDEMWKGEPVRHLGIHAGKITDKDIGRQGILFENRDFEKLEKLDQAVDGIRIRYGMDAVKRAVFLKSPIDHMSGGVSREKRSVDYGKYLETV